MPLAIACTDEEKVAVTATPLTSKGKPAKIDGALKVTIQSGDGTVEQDAASPLSFNAVSGDLLADTVYLVEADADLGAGVVTVSDTVTLTVGSATAASLGFTSSAPVPK